MQDKIETIKRLLDSVHCVKNIDEAISSVLNKLLICPFCDEYFADAPALTDHIKKFHPDRLKSKSVKVDKYEVNEDAETIYICPHCLFAVDNFCPSPTSSIIDHMSTHSASAGPNAKTSFQVSSDKKLIQTYVNGKMKVDLCQCAICNDMIVDKESLLRHLHLKHSSSDSRDIPVETIELIRDSVKDFPTKEKTKRKYTSKYLF